MKLLLLSIVLSLSSCIVLDEHHVRLGDIGDGCYDNDDCYSDWCRQHSHYTDDPSWWTTFPGGLCTLPCSYQGDCGPYGMCIDSFGEPTPYCIARCEVDEQCRPEWECYPFGWYGDQGCWPTEPYRPIK